MTTHLVLTDDSSAAVPLYALSGSSLAAWATTRASSEQQWIASLGFKAEAGAVLILPGADGKVAGAVVGLGKGEDPWVLGGMAKALPPGVYRLAAVEGVSDALGRDFPRWAAQAWALGAYMFARYKKGSGDDKALAKLVWPEGCDRAAATRTVAAMTLTRDLVNTPAADMLPQHLADAAKRLAQPFGATVREIIGDDLLTQNYPMIHAVGRASAVAPRLIDMLWGEANHPKITLVGKGVCFDSGGLDIKPASAMALMKKDMGGAATVLGLAHAIMAARLPVRLRVLIPAVENAVAGNAFRPGDVLRSRKGLSVEIGNTDAEGRLVLADALTEACAEKPALLIDCATLTGAARTALGPELPALFTDDDALAADLQAAAARTYDPLWRLPLWAPYRRMLDTKVADINNAGDSPFAGAITAALFLKEFVDPGVPWAHVDLFAWNKGARPGRPDGGEALSQRALFALVEKWFAG